MNISPTQKAWATTVFFAVAGICGAYLGRDSVLFLPHTLFYAVITLNTFFSVQVFSKIQPKNFGQMICDLLLVISYVALAFSIGTPIAFPLFATLLFIIATIKYVLMRGKIPHDAFLRHKILIDCGGIALCTSSYVLVLIGYPLHAAWILGIIFALANVYLLGIKPMYRLF